MLGLLSFWSCGSMSWVALEGWVHSELPALLELEGTEGCIAASEGAAAII